MLNCLGLYCIVGINGKDLIHCSQRRIDRGLQPCVIG